MGADIPGRISDDASPFVPDGNHDPFPKHRIKLAFLVFSEHPQFNQKLFVQCLLTAIVHERMAFPGRITDTRFCTEVLRPSVVGILPGMTAVVIGGHAQMVCKEGLYLFQYGIQRILVSLFRLVGIRTLFIIFVLHQDVELLGQQADSLLKVQVLLFHNKGDAVTAPVAAEAVIEVLVQVDREGGCVFAMERTESFHAGTSVLG